MSIKLDLLDLLEVGIASERNCSYRLGSLRVELLAGELIGHIELRLPRENLRGVKFLKFQEDIRRVRKIVMRDRLADFSAHLQHARRARIGLRWPEIHRRRRRISKRIVPLAYHAPILPPAIPTRQHREQIKLIPRQQPHAKHRRANHRPEYRAGDMRHVRDRFSPAEPFGMNLANHILRER